MHPDHGLNLLLIQRPDCRVEDLDHTVTPPQRHETIIPCSAVPELLFQPFIERTLQMIIRDILVGEPDICLTAPNRRETGIRILTIIEGKILQKSVRRSGIARASQDDRGDRDVCRRIRRFAPRRDCLAAILRHAVPAGIPARHRHKRVREEDIGPDNSLLGTPACVVRVRNIDVDRAAAKELKSAPPIGNRDEPDLQPQLLCRGPREIDGDSLRLGRIPAGGASISSRTLSRDRVLIPLIANPDRAKALHQRGLLLREHRSRSRSRLLLCRAAITLALFYRITLPALLLLCRCRAVLCPHPVSLRLHLQHAATESA